MKIAFQAILDKKLNIFGYESLYRENDPIKFFTSLSKESIFKQKKILREIFFKEVYYFNKFFDKKLHHFININSLIINYEIVKIVLKYNLIIEVNEKEKFSKFKIFPRKNLCLDDIEERIIREYELKNVNFVKISINSFQNRKDLIYYLKNKQKKYKYSIILEKIENIEDFRKYKDMGDYFQGYFYHKGVLIND